MKETVNHSDRITSVDSLRGIVMIIMALDHVRFFFHRTAISQNPEDIHTTTPALFFTRWVTHFCAPVFIVLTGLSAGLLNEKGISNKALFKFLAVRGLLLILLELTLFRFGWDFNFMRPEIDLLVIWAIGVSMIYLSLAIFLPRSLLLISAMLIICCHNLLDNIIVDPSTPGYYLWLLLHQHDSFNLTPALKINILYPSLPFFGLISLGYCLGLEYKKWKPAKRQKILVYSGTTLIVLFVLLRSFNLYGDPLKWRLQENFSMTAISFLKTTKYPVSLQYLLMTLGPATLLLAYLEHINVNYFNATVMIGSVPMFYYSIHLYLIHCLTILTGGPNNCSLSVVYLAWVLVVLILYVPCRKFSSYKFSHKGKKWLRYL